MSAPRLALRAGLAALLLIALATPRLAGSAPSAPPKRLELRDARSLPTLDQLQRALPANSIFSTSDTFLVSSSGFDQSTASFAVTTSAVFDVPSVMSSRSLIPFFSSNAEPISPSPPTNTRNRVRPALTSSPGIVYVLMR